MNISDSFPSLINGVSQQAEALRLDSQVQDQQNAVASVVDGLSKRQPTQHIAKLSNGTLTAPYIHLINRDSTERYLLEMSNGSLKVFDLTGTQMTLLTPDGTSYLTITNPAFESFRAVTVEDTTFIVNREVTPAMSSSNTAAFPTGGMIWIKQGLIGHEYLVDIEMMPSVGTLTSALAKGTSYTTLAVTALTSALTSGSTITLKNGTDGTTPQMVVLSSNASLGATSISVTSFTAGFAFPIGSTVNPGYGFMFQDTTSTTFVASTAVAKGLYDSITAKLSSTYNVQINENLLFLAKKSGADFSIAVYDTFGNQAMSLLKGSVSGEGDLPNKSFPGVSVKVQGDANSNSDDFYVTFVPDVANTFGTGAWVECVAPGISVGFDATTMPYILQRTALNTFTFSKAPWALRTAGDETSSLRPSLIGNPINDVFVYQGRLGLLAGESVLFSQASEFYNFWPTTATTILDDDRIDYRVGGTGVTFLYHAVPFQDRLILFSDQSQLTLTNGDTLTAKTVSATVSTFFDGLVNASPVNDGNSILFAFKRGDYSGVREYFVASELGSITDAADITAHVPRYINGNIVSITVSTAISMAAIQTDAGDNSLYIYQWLWNGPQKIQSAWGKWIFDGNPIGSFFVSDTIYVVLQRSDGVWLEKLQLAQNVDSGSTYITCLDRRTTATYSSYNASTNTSTFTVPYYSVNLSIVYNGTKLNVSSVTNTGGTGTVVVFGKHQANATAGIPYTFSVTFTRPFVKVPNSTGGKTTINQNRLQVTDFFVRYANTGFFTVSVKPDLYNTYTYDFTGRIIGSANNIIGSVCIESGVLKIPIRARSDDMTVTLTNDTFMPCYLLSCEWTGMYNITSRRF